MKTTRKKREMRKGEENTGNTEKEEMTQTRHEGKKQRATEDKLSE